MSLILCALSPHPPLLVPAIGRDNLEQVRASEAALKALARTVVEQRPDTVLILSPHGPVRMDAVSLLMAERVEACFQGFELSYALPVDVETAERIREEARHLGYPVSPCTSFDSPRYYFSRGLDHATMVPLYYLKEAGLDCSMVFMSIAAWSHREHFGFGEAIRRAVEGTDRRVVVLASGDLSHRLIPTAPAGYEPRGAEFDRRIVDDLSRMDVADVLNLDDEFIDRIGECGLRPLSTMLGTLKGCAVRSRVLSYEGPFGVGYCVAELVPSSTAAERVAEAEAGSTAPERVAEAGAVERDGAYLLELVKGVVERFVKTRETPVLPAEVPAFLRQRAGAFVCIKKGGQLRGCIGTTAPTQESLAHELVQNAISACSRDPRFLQVTDDELPELRYSVDVLEVPEPAGSLDDLDPDTYGVIVRSGWRTGVLLPHLDGVTSAHMQVEIAREKAGIPPGEKLDLMRFRVRRYEEEG